MQRVCAWCKRPLAHNSNGADHPTITYGICQTCTIELFGGEGMKLNEFLNTLQAPVLVVDDSGAVQTANEKALNMLGKALPEVEGYPGGEVFNCINAALPEGCGYTPHCQTCTVRNTVMTTLHTGQNFTRVPVYLHTTQGQMKFLVSTQCAGGCVLLQIDAASNALILESIPIRMVTS